LAVSHLLENAFAPLRNSNRRWYAHRLCSDLSVGGFRWNRSKNSKDWPYSSDCDCDISTVVGKTLWPFRKYTGGWRPALRSFDARSGALGMFTPESDTTGLALYRRLRSARFEPEADPISNGQTPIKQGRRNRSAALTITSEVWRKVVSFDRCRGRPFEWPPLRRADGLRWRLQGGSSCFQLLGEGVQPGRCQLIGPPGVAPGAGRHLPQAGGGLGAQGGGIAATRHHSLRASAARTIGARIPLRNSHCCALGATSLLCVCPATDGAMPHNQPAAAPCWFARLGRRLSGIAGKEP
jgi:hypothetical protein